MRAHENPFRSSEIAKLRYRMPVEQQGVLLRTLLGRPGCQAIVGVPGTGKTTLMEDLAMRQQEWHPEAPRIRIGLNRESPSADRWRALRTISRAPSGAVVYFDGAEVLDRLRLRWLARAVRRGGLYGLVSLHRRRGGIPVLWETAPDAAVMEVLVARLVAGDPDEKLQAVAREAFRENGGNLREVFGACYREIADR